MPDTKRRCEAALVPELRAHGRCLNKGCWIRSGSVKPRCTSRNCCSAAPLLLRPRLVLGPEGPRGGVTSRSRAGAAAAIAPLGDEGALPNTEAAARRKRPVVGVEARPSRSAGPAEGDAMLLRARDAPVAATRPASRASACGGVLSSGQPVGSIPTGGVSHLYFQASCLPHSCSCVFQLSSCSRRGALKPHALLVELPRKTSRGRLGPPRLRTAGRSSLATRWQEAGLCEHAPVSHAQFCCHTACLVV